MKLPPEDHALIASLSEADRQESDAWRRRLAPFIANRRYSEAIVHILTSTTEDRTFRPFNILLEEVWDQAPSDEIRKIIEAFPGEPYDHMSNVIRIRWAQELAEHTGIVQDQHFLLDQIDALRVKLEIQSNPDALCDLGEILIEAGVRLNKEELILEAEAVAHDLWKRHEYYHAGQIYEKLCVFYPGRSSFISGFRCAFRDEEFGERLRREIMMALESVLPTKNRLHILERIYTELDPRERAFVTEGLSLNLKIFISTALVKIFVGQA